MNYSDEILAKLALFHNATILMVKLKEENRESERLNNFCLSLGQELAFNPLIDIEDITAPNKFSHIKLTDEQVKILEGLSMQSSQT